METDNGRNGKLCSSQQHPEDELKEYQAKFKALFDNVRSGVAIYEARNDGEEFVFVDFNAAAEDIDQITKEELIGKACHGLQHKRAYGYVGLPNIGRL